MGIIEPYSGEIDAFSGYYIHFHQQNIGYAGGHKPVNIVQKFVEQRQQASQSNIEAYKALLMPNISSDSSDLLNELFSDEDMMSELDKQIKEKIEKNLSNDNRLKNLMEEHRKLFDPKGSFINTFQTAGSQIKSFDILLESLAKAVNLLETDEGSALALILQNAKTNNSNAGNIRVMGIQLQKALNAFIAKNEGGTFSQDQAAKAAREINNLANAMASKTTKSGTSYSKGAIQHLVDSIFNVGLAEGIAAVSAKIGTESINDSFLELTGNKNHKLFIYEPGKDLVAFNNTPASGKADSIQKNVNMSFEYNAKKMSGNITFNLGLSNKFYRTQHFKDLDQKNKLQISGGSGGLTVGAAINKLFGDEFTRYLAFNVIAHRSERPEEARELQNLIIKRFMTNFISSRGGKDDFSQFIIANGEVVSVWELVMYARNQDNFLGYSQSTAEGREQPIAISIPDGPEIEARTKSEHSFNNQYQRCVDVNALIHKAKMTSHIHVNKLAQAYKK